MSVYESIRHRIFDHENTAPPSKPPIAGSAHPIEASSATDLVGALSSRAADQPENLHWQSSIIDLMQLLGIDSSIANRRLLAHELSYSGDESDSVMLDKWLHFTVMNKLTGNAHHGVVATPTVS